MTPEERDAAYHTLITCDGKGKEAKAEALRRLIEWHRDDARRDALGGTEHYETTRHLIDR